MGDEEKKGKIEKSAEKTGEVVGKVGKALSAGVAILRIAERKPDIPAL
jgi:hypothetical protein